MRTTSRRSGGCRTRASRARVLWLAVLLAMLPGHAAADGVHGPYLGLRLGQQLQVDRTIAHALDADSFAHSLYGVSLGVDIGRHFGVEVAADFFELDPRIRGAGRLRGIGSIGELGTTTLVPQLRLRYPLLDGRLVPYLVGGVGVSFTQFNDRKRDGFGLSIHAEDTALAWTAGAGLEYFVAGNIALGGEIRYAGLADHTIEVEGRSEGANLDSVLVGASARVYLGDGARAARFDATPRAWTPYLTLRVGGASLVDDEIARDIETRNDNNDIVPGMSNVLGFALGVDVGRFVAVEVAGEGYEVNLVMPGLGTVSEYAVVSFLAQVRLRYPLLDGRLLPALIAGAGATFAEFNDRKPPADAIVIRARDFSPAGVIGIGLEYLLAPNIGVGVDVKYLISRGHVIGIDGEERRATLDTVFVTGGLRLLFR